MINTIIEGLNRAGAAWWDFSAGMFWQAGMLITILLLLDWAIKGKVRAVVRYVIWMLVLVKLVLPTGLAAPTGIMYWAHDAIGNYFNASGGEGQGAASVQNELMSGAAGNVAQADAGENQIFNAMLSAGAAEHAAVEAAGDRAAAGAGAVITWQGLLFAGWAAGVMALAVVLVQRAMFARALARQGEAAGEEYKRVLDECRAKLEVGEEIEMRVTSNMLSPAVWGISRHVILVPEKLLAGLDGGQLRAVLTHELVHVRRGDLLINLVQSVLQILYFYNPLVWIANARIRQVREQAVDEASMASLGDEARDYGATLVSVAEMALSRGQLGLRLVGVVESEKSLAGRIRHIMSRPMPKTAKVGIGAMMAVAVMGMVLLPMARAEKSLATESTENSEKNGNFKKTLGNNVTVEVVGICEYPSRGKAWWRPDGSELGYVIETNDPSKYTSKEKGFEIAYRYEAADGVHVGLPVVKGSTQQSGLEVVGPEGIHAVRSHIDVWGSTTAVKIPVAAGDWKVLGQTNGRGQTIKKVGSKQIVFGPAEGTREKLVLAVTDDLKDYDSEFRLVAVDLKGNDVFSKANWLSQNNLRLHTFVFTGVDLNDVSRFEFQSRPYEYVEFKDVSLRPKKAEAMGGRDAEWRAKVEDFFKHNYRDITSRKTVEWGEPVKDANGNTSISYKYEMVLWDKDKFLACEVFTFDKDGKFVKVEKAAGYPQKIGTIEPKTEDVSSEEAVKKLVEKFFTRNYRDISARRTIEWGGLVRDANSGNVSIRYKYEATIRGDEKVINDETFTFDKKGQFVKVKRAGLKDVSFYQGRDPNELGIRVYQVGKKVSEFGEVDFSRPEYTMVKAARISADGNGPGWSEISEPGLAKRMKSTDMPRRKISEKQARKYLESEILEVHTKGVRATVISMSRGMVMNEYHVRSFKLVEGKWLNVGEGGASTLSGARAQADQGVDYFDYRDKNE